MIRRPHNRRRLAVSAAITLFWLAMMALLVRDYVLPLRASADALPLASGQLAGNWRDFEEWMSLRVGEKSDGVSYTLVEQREDGGDFLAANRTWLDLDLLGARHAFRLETVALLDPQFALQCATVVLRIDDTPLQFKTLVTPRRLLYRLEFEGQVHVGAQPLKGPVSLLEAVRPLVAQRLELAVGRVYRLPVFDSTWSLRQGVAEIRVEALDDIPFQGQMVQAYRVVTQLGPHRAAARVQQHRHGTRQCVVGAQALQGHRCADPRAAGRARGVRSGDRPRGFAGQRDRPAESAAAPLWPKATLTIRNPGGWEARRKTQVCNIYSEQCENNHNTIQESQGRKRLHQSRNPKNQEKSRNIYVYTILRGP